MDPVRKGLRAASAALRVVHDQPADPSLIDSRAAAWRLAIALIAATLGNAPMYVLAVALPAVQSDFGIGRGEAAFAYTAMMVGLGAGGYLCGRWADRFGVWRVLALGGVGTLAGFGLAASAPGLAVFVIAHCVLLGFLGIGSSYGPLMADTALWWQKRRGVAVAVVASGNFLAGTIWPPIVQAGIEAIGWRGTFWALGVVCGLGIVLLSLFIRERPPKIVVPPPSPDARASGITPNRPFGLSVNAAQWVLFIAAVGCCVAMAMPQVHIVAYCGDLGYGSAAGAQMLSLMLGFGIVSRLISGWVADRIGGLRTLLAGAVLQAVALSLYLPFDGLGALYVIAILFGLFQGGIVPSYALVVREYFPAAGSATRIALVINSTLLGMALGGWLSGSIFDLTGSYDAAFVNGIVWNLLTVLVAVVLLRRSRLGRQAPIAA
jgi:MFS family permease